LTSGRADFEKRGTEKNRGLMDLEQKLIESKKTQTSYQKGA